MDSCSASYPHAIRALAARVIPELATELRSGLDATVAYVESLPPDAPVALKGGGAFIKWAEALEGGGDVAIEREDGQPAVMSAGKVHYIGGWPDPVAWRRLIESACQAEGIETVALPDNLRIRDTQKRRYVFNYGPAAVTVDGQTVPAAGVIWEDR